MDTISHISTIPLLSRFYENTTRELYDKNAAGAKVNVIKEIEPN